MAKIILGERMGKQATTLTLACSAVIFDPTKQKLLLTRRADNGRWCLPGGHMEPGESLSEACAREVWEETGLQVRVGRLIGVYSNPHRLIEYGNGRRYSIVVLSFTAEPTGGTLGISDETTECGYFSRAEMTSMDIMETSQERIEDAFARQEAAFIR
jgi:ADP-ribose pyrophosphatase YjhB (NUDIX family)